MDSERQRKEIVKQIGGKSSKVAMTIGEPKEMIQGIGTKDMKINIPFEFKSLDDIEKYEKMLNRKMTEDSKKAIVAELVKKGLAPLNSMSKLFPPKETPVETVVLLNNKFAKAKDFVQIGIDAEDYYRIKDAKRNE